MHHVVAQRGHARRRRLRRAHAPLLLTHDGQARVRVRRHRADVPPAGNGPGQRSAVVTPAAGWTAKWNHVQLPVPRGPPKWNHLHNDRDRLGQPGDAEDRVPADRAATADPLAPIASTCTSPRRLTSVTTPGTSPRSTYPVITSCMRRSRTGSALAVGGTRRVAVSCLGHQSSAD